MTEFATVDWFGRGGGTSVFSENTAIFLFCHALAYITYLLEFGCLKF